MSTQFKITIAALAMMAWLPSAVANVYEGSDIVSQDFWSDACEGYCSEIQRGRDDYVIVVHDPTSGKFVTAQSLQLNRGETIGTSSSDGEVYEPREGSYTSSGTPNPPHTGTGIVQVNHDVFDTAGNLVAIVTVTYVFLNDDLIDVNTTRHDLDPR